MGDKGHKNVTVKIKEGIEKKKNVIGNKNMGLVINRMGWAAKEKKGRATTLHPRAGQKVALHNFHLLTLAARGFLQ